MSRPEWSREVEYVSPTGVKTKLYSISVLAQQLGRTSQTVRKWEIGGVIPKTPFKDNRGARLYSIAQIRSVVESAEKSNIKPGKKLAGLKFSDRIYEDFERLNNHYFNEIDPELSMEE